VVSGDSIYNGVADNAMAARPRQHCQRLVQAKEKPSIVFLVVTVKSRACWARRTTPATLVFGAHHRGRPEYGTTCPRWVPCDLTVVGYGQSELDDYAMPRPKSRTRFPPDPNADKGYFRPDHFAFAHVGCVLVSRQRPG
jgi:hypothetical protein